MLPMFMVRAIVKRSPALINSLSEAPIDNGRCAQDCREPQAVGGEVVLICGSERAAKYSLRHGIVLLVEF